jgi:apolipoprotein N-acyltransferase
MKKRTITIYTDNPARATADAKHKYKNTRYTIEPTDTAKKTYKVHIVPAPPQEPNNPTS